MSFDVDIISNLNNDVIAIKQKINKSIDIKNYNYIKGLIDKTVKDSNYFYTQVCYLIKLFLLFESKENNFYNDYVFNEKFIIYCFRLIRTNGIIDNENIDDKNIYKRIQNFFVNFNKDDKNVKFKYPNDILSMIHITDALARDIQTNIINNITINYLKYVKEYININLKIDFKDNNNIKIDKTVIFNVFNDIIYSTYYTNSIFHNWIIKHKKYLIPNVTNIVNIDSIETGIKNNYKNLMIFITKYVKENESLNDIITYNNEKNINKLIKSIIFDITNSKFDSDIKYHDWIKKNKIIIINEFNKLKSIDIDKELEKNPFIFIPNMLFINKNLENNKSKKKYQIIPIRTNMIPKFIPIYSDSLVDLLDSTYLLGEIKNYYHADTKRSLKLFETYFDFSSKFIKNTIKKGYKFSGTILTNGHEIIFNFFSQSYLKQKNIYHSSAKIEKEHIKKLIENKTEEEQKNIINENNIIKNKKKVEKDKLNKEKLKIKKENDKKKLDLKLNAIKLDNDNLDNGYKINYENLIKKHYDNLNEELNKIDKTNIENKEQMNLIVLELNEKLSSDKSYLLHCHCRDKKALIDDYQNEIEIKYNEFVENDLSNNIKIKKLKVDINHKKKELNKLKNNQFKSLKLEKTTESNKIINDFNNSKKKRNRIIDLIKKNMELLKFSTEITIEHTKKIKIKLIKKIKILCLTYSNLKNYIDETFKNTDLFENEFMNLSIQEIISFLIHCLRTISIETTHKKNILFETQYQKNKINFTNLCIKKNNETIEYKDKNNCIIKKLKILNDDLNKLIKIKNNIENKLINLFKIKSENMKIDDIGIKTLKILDKTNWVVIDPGMNSLLTMMSKDDKKTLSYTKSHYLSMTKRKEIMKKIERIKKEKINKLENQLTKDNQRFKTSNNYEIFKTYYNLKMKLHTELENLYNDVRLNKLRWYMFINEKRSESKLITQIKNKFNLSKDNTLKTKPVLIIGDWSMNKKNIKSISTPNKKYEKLLNKNFPMLKINEFRTSKIHNETNNICENYIKKYDIKNINIKSVYSLEKIKEKNELLYKNKIKDQKVHKILVCKTNVELKVHFINRDKNSVKNMKSIINSYITLNHKPKTFVMGTKIGIEANKS
jgi:hypothetical protein